LDLLQDAVFVVREDLLVNLTVTLNTSDYRDLSKSSYSVVLCAFDTEFLALHREVSSLFKRRSDRKLTSDRPDRHTRSGGLKDLCM
jgi:hypothetical protein